MSYQSLTQLRILTVYDLVYVHAAHPTTRYLETYKHHTDHRSDHDEAKCEM